ncbi:MAG: alpha-ketoglutarate-dependent dioxygenase AlkB [Rhodobacteraceae bacterium]|nr:alpha-ketoglutarate-dependent dioxygenase AlkB [Paracoccaceae bacterium]MCY4250614.1 alpha-ketoglutarate-dependent dioxygenase AlkB [Paracoccaceae bacterium]
MNATTEPKRGFIVHRNFLSQDKQMEMVESIREIVRQAPFNTLRTPSGKKMSVKMTSAGNCGWFSDQHGYRYEPMQSDGKQWPPIPPLVLEIWQNLVSMEKNPDTCLINYYEANAKMGLHQDRDEKDFSWPVLSISLGDEALFRIGNAYRGGKTESFWLHSGDVVIMGGDARLCYHGIDRIKFGTSNLLRQSGRINLTLRVVS